MSQHPFARRCACAVVATLLALAAGRADDKDKPKELPKGSEKAVEAVKKEFPKAEIDEVAEPKGFGGSGGKGTPLFWDDLPAMPLFLANGVHIRVPLEPTYRSAWEASPEEMRTAVETGILPEGDAEGD
jgi:hypothetical protein